MVSPRRARLRLSALRIAEGEVDWGRGQVFRGSAESLNLLIRVVCRAVGGAASRSPP